jgi:histidinol-phosphate aminotransferase
MANINLADWVQEKIKSLKAYEVENFDCEVKLHANENPFSLPEEFTNDFSDGCKNIQLNRYPDPDCRLLKQAITDITTIPPESLVIGNGSDELIQLILQIFCDAGDSYAFPDPTFGMYSIIGKGLGLVPHPYPLDENWDFDGDDLLGFLSEQNARVVFFSYPNNPTGNCYSAPEIKKIIAGFQGIVVLDEAYYDFAQHSFCQEIKNHNNLIVLRSLSKIGLAALRVGYGMADPYIIEQINKVRLPYNSNTVSQEFAARLMRKFSPIQEQIKLILGERDRLLKELSQFKSLTVFPSDSNFILFRVADNGVKLFKDLVENGILIRNLNAHPRLKNCLRVTVGTQKENDIFLAQLGKMDL